MCGRFAVDVPVPDLLRLFAVAEGRASQRALTLPLRYNVAPMADVLAVVLGPDGERSADALRWGFVPAFARDPHEGTRMINARAESVWDRPAFRDSMRRRRCLVPVSGFYEWRRAEGGRGRPQPYYIRRRDGRPMALAGIWSTWRPKVPGAGDTQQVEALRTFAILTTRANALVGQIHDRMPVLVPEQAWSLWLRPDAEPEVVSAYLQPCPTGELEAYPVTPAVNRPAFDEPAATQPTGPPLRAGTADAAPGADAGAVPSGSTA